MNNCETFLLDHRLTNEFILLKWEVKGDENHVKNTCIIIGLPTVSGGMVIDMQK